MKQLTRIDQIVSGGYSTFAYPNDEACAILKNWSEDSTDESSGLVRALHSSKDMYPYAAECESAIRQIAVALSEIAEECFRDESIEYVTVNTSLREVKAHGKELMGGQHLKSLSGKCSAKYYIKDDTGIAMMLDTILSGWYTELSCGIIRTEAHYVFDEELHKHYPGGHVVGITYGYIIERD